MIFGKFYDIIVREISQRGVAQLVEQRSPKPRVVSSSLAAPAKFVTKIAYLGDFSCSLIH